MIYPHSRDSSLVGRGDSFRGGLLVASNLEPYSHRRTPSAVKLDVATGGLVSSLDTVLRITGGTWVAWGSGSGDRVRADEKGRLWVPPSNPAYKLRRVWLSPNAVENYYRGFCNRVLWPLFHGEPEHIRFHVPYWDGYQRTNRLFADTILEEGSEDATVWIHDHHLCLVPAMLRAANPRRNIAHFWHVPWPEPDLFNQFHHAAEIVAGLLGNDLIGFQTPSYAKNFLKCAEACPGTSVDHDEMTVSLLHGRITRVRAFPTSIDFNRFESISGSAETSAKIPEIRAKYRLPKLVGLAVDHLDYTKGIVRRFEALDLFFRCNPGFRGKFSFVQIIAMPGNSKPYLSHRREVEERIAEINGKYGTTKWQPVLYFRNKLEQDELAAWYRLADVAVIAPICDGMNLVAKEYAAARCDGTGVLILGKDAGAAEELVDALLVDPTDTGVFACAIHRALTMPEGEKRKRMSRLRNQIRENTIFDWVGAIVDELALIPALKQGTRHALSCRNEIQKRLSGKDLLLCLDFDGTLAPIVEQPETAAMPDAIIAIIQELKERYPIAVISGRNLADLRKRVGLEGVTYEGNNGADMEGLSAFESGRPLMIEFLTAARNAFSSFPGVQIEDKEMTASIHFRRISPMFLEHFLSAFRRLAGDFKDTLIISEERKVFEIRPQGTWNKGDAVLRLMEGVFKGRFPVYIGDDSSDEAGFRAVRGEGLSVSVGGNPETDYYLRNQGEVHEFLTLIAGISHQHDQQCNSKGNQKRLSPYKRTNKGCRNRDRQLPLPGSP